MKFLRILTVISVIFFTSCAELAQIMSQYGTNQPLTEREVIGGLKEALVVGTGNAVEKLAIRDGYFKDELIKILLPEEAAVIVDNISKIPGGRELVNNVIMSINRAAEDAAKEVKPIFVGSITSMTINDAFNILRGNDNAATEYLKRTTFDQLFNLYKPKINNSLNKKLIGNISTNESWNELTGQWNKIARSPIGMITGFKPVDIELDAYLTEKALDGLFLKISDTEKRIREDPIARVSELLKRVFGSLDS